jgi:hypothetical protein
MTDKAISVGRSTMFDGSGAGTGSSRGTELGSLRAGKRR